MILKKALTWPGGDQGKLPRGGDAWLSFEVQLGTRQAKLVRRETVVKVLYTT